MENLEKQGCVDIWIDEIVPCLKDCETGAIKDTIAFKIDDKKFLKKFRKSNGWHINWDEIPHNVEVYALALKDDNSIQGLIGIVNDMDAHAVYIHWACTAPHNNKYEYGTQKYIGVGCHLFAIAIDKSIKWGYEGAVYGYAADEKLLFHYIETFNAEYLGILHKYQFIIDEKNAQKILEVYNYEWNA